MISAAGIKISIPSKTSDEIIRGNLTSKILRSDKKLTYVHAGAGYGKTTLLAQVCRLVDNAVWVTLDGEGDIFSFIDFLSEAIRHSFPDIQLNFSQYLPFEGKDNFITILANALISGIENISGDLTIVLDDLHTIEDQNIKDFITCLIKYKPENTSICVGSREAPWKEFVALQARGSIMEITRSELSFTFKEAAQILGFEDEDIYTVTEGWPLGIRSFKVLIENGADIDYILSHGNPVLDSYLLYECTGRLPEETVESLKTFACFEELDPKMLDAITGRKGTRSILDNLVTRNIFTSRTKDGQYHFHALFKKHLLNDIEISEQKQFHQKAGAYYYERKDYSQAAKYAIMADDNELLEKIILSGFNDRVGNGNFSELRNWFSALEDNPAHSSQKISLARGIFLSSIGNFSNAKVWLDNVKPIDDPKGEDLFFEALVHKARILRNSSSFEESNQLLDNLLANIESLDPDKLYKAGIEKIYNLCWDSKIRDAYDTINLMIETCARSGNLSAVSRFERYLTAVHFFAGKMKDAVYYYEKSLCLPEQELEYLDMHNVDMYAAKAYQMLGFGKKAEETILKEIQKLKTKGQYEELWACYLLAAEIYYHIADMGRRNSKKADYNTANKYFSLGIEYASLYRTSKFQLEWAKMQKLVYSLIFSDAPNENIIEEILSNLENVGDYLKTVVLGRLFSYYISVSDFPNAAKYAVMSIEIGEKAGIMMIPTIAYGFLAGAHISKNNHEKAASLATRFLKLCSENGIYDYFKIRGLYGCVLQFALDNNIETNFAGKMMSFAGYKTKKIYISTFGGFNIYSYENMQKPLKMRSKKERELLAYLLDTGNKGATKEHIYNAIWSETESDNVRKLIGVNLSHIKKDLAAAGVEKPIVNRGNHYYVCRDEIECDYEAFEEAGKHFFEQKSAEAARRIVYLYKGEYLSDFEAFWATSKRIEYLEIYEQALEFLTSC